MGADVEIAKRRAFLSALSAIFDKGAPGDEGSIPRKVEPSDLWCDR